MIECYSLCYIITIKGDQKLKCFVLNLCRPTPICACGHESQPSVIHRNEEPTRTLPEVSSFDKHDENNKPSENVGKGKKWFIAVEWKVQSSYCSFYYTINLPPSLSLNPASRSCSVIASRGASDTYTALVIFISVIFLCPAIISMPLMHEKRRKYEYGRCPLSARGRDRILH